MMPSPLESVADRSFPSPEQSRGVRDAAKAGATQGTPVGSRGALIINADDWGRDRDNTDRTFQCVSRGTVTSVSAMVFMEDSERAASIARENRIDAGLHLNFTTAFSTKDCQSELLEHQSKLAKYLLSNRFSQVLFHPVLANSFEYVVSHQLDEFHRTYGDVPQRLDGHHHMHLCSNVLLGRLMPAGTLVRRSFSFQPGEKSWLNRFYRRLIDRLLASRHRTTDYFFSIEPLDPAKRLQQIFKLADTYTIEVETHPVRLEEFRFLMGDDILCLSERMRSAVLGNGKAQIAGAQDQPAT
jgi:predicted glycoside hydrolase/deacetylase ChbG (UPF0249 family)